MAVGDVLSVHLCDCVLLQNSREEFVIVICYSSNRLFGRVLKVFYYNHIVHPARAIP